MADNEQRQWEAREALEARARAQAEQCGNGCVRPTGHRGPCRLAGEPHMHPDAECGKSYDLGYAHGKLGMVSYTGEHPPTVPVETLRDRFAMAALTGLCADPSSGHDDRSTVEQTATWCYDIADAMLAARGKR